MNKTYLQQAETIIALRLRISNYYNLMTLSEKNVRVECTLRVPLPDDLTSEVSHATFDCLN